MISYLKGSLLRPFCLGHPRPCGEKLQTPVSRVDHVGIKVYWRFYPQYSRKLKSERDFERLTKNIKIHDRYINNASTYTAINCEINILKIHPLNLKSLSRGFLLSLHGCIWVRRPKKRFQETATRLNSDCAPN